MLGLIILGVVMRDKDRLSVEEWAKRSNLQSGSLEARMALAMARAEALVLFRSVNTRLDTTTITDEVENSGTALTNYQVRLETAKPEKPHRKVRKAVPGFRKLEKKAGGYKSKVKKNKGIARKWYS